MPAFLNLIAVLAGVGVAVWATKHRLPRQMWSREEVLPAGFVALFAATTLPNGDTAHSMAWAFMLGLVLMASIWDMRHHLIPNQITAFVWIPALIIASTTPDAGFVLIAVLTLTLLMTPFGIGGGDALILPAIAVIVYPFFLSAGWIWFTWSFIALSLLMPLLGISWKRFRDEIPLAPGFLAAAALAPFIGVAAQSLGT